MDKTSLQEPSADWAEVIQVLGEALQRLVMESDLAIIHRIAQAALAHPAVETALRR